MYAILTFEPLKKIDPGSKGKISRHKAGTPTRGKLTLFLPKEIIIVSLNILKSKLHRNRFELII